MTDQAPREPVPSSNQDPPPAATISSNKTALERMVNRISHTDEFPAISKYLIEINQKLSANPENSNAFELANIILQDYALTNKMLKLVNSAFYGLTAGKVTTITRAVVILGYENIRLATLSLVLFEHLRNKSNTAALKEAMVCSFWLGLMAQDIAIDMKDSRIDPEEALVCAMMSQLGKLLIIHYMPKEYQKICDYMTQHHESEAKAARMVCKITYEDLGKAMANQWNFPGRLGDCMEILDKNALKNQNKPSFHLVALCSFAKEIAEIVQDDEHPSKEHALEQLLKRYKHHVRISQKKLKALIQNSVTKIHRYLMALNMDIETSHFIDNLVSFFLTEAATSALVNQPADPQEFTETGAHCGVTPTLDTLDSKDILMEGIQEISKAMLADNDINDVVVISLEVLYRALGFQRTLMFIRGKNQLKMKARFGYGDNSQHLIRNVEFPIEGNLDLFNMSIKAGKDLIVADTHDPKLTNLIPGWYHRNIDAPAFLFLPVMFQNTCIAAFYADRNKKGEPISAMEHRHLNMLRNQLLLAFKYQWAGK